MPTEEEIDAKRTPAGGWTKAQLAEWGVPWPPPRGWRKQLISQARKGMTLDNGQRFRVRIFAEG